MAFPQKVFGLTGHGVQYEEAIEETRLVRALKEELKDEMDLDEVKWATREKQLTK